MKIKYILTFILILNICFAQNCTTLKETRNDSIVTTNYGIVISKELSSLKLTKETLNYRDSSQTNFMVHLIVPAGVQLADTVFKTKGHLTFLLSDNSSLIIDSVKCERQELTGYPLYVFIAYTNKETFERIAKTQIRILKAFTFYACNFNTRGQKQQKQILDCILNK